MASSHVEGIAYDHVSELQNPSISIAYFATKFGRKISHVVNK